MTKVAWIQQLGLTPTASTTSTAQLQTCAIALGSDGSLYVGSTTQTETDVTEPTQQATLAQYNLSGEQQWQQAVNLPMAATLTHVAVGRDGLYALGIVKIDAEPTTAGLTQTEVWLAQYSLSGQQQWLHKLRSVSPQQPDDLLVDDRGFLYIAGHTTPAEGEGESEGWLAKYDPDGDRLWQTGLGKYEHPAPLRLWLGEDPSARTKFARMAIYVAGSTAMPLAVPQTETGEDAPQQTWLARYSSEGIQRWITALGPSASLYFTSLSTDDAHQLQGVGQALKAGVLPVGPWLAQYDAQGQQVAFVAFGLEPEQTTTQVLPTATGLQLVGLSAMGEVWVATYTTDGLGPRLPVAIEGQVQQVTGAIAIADGLILSGQTMTDVGLQQWVAKVMP